MAGTDEKIELMDESDRSVFIVAAAMLEEELQKILREEFRRNNIPNKLINQLFDLNGLCQIFHQKSLYAMLFV
ncbi:MAG: hypothetical protein KKA55_02310 [Proteobacteria bacterium]|nr:hypothetical protein [Pseudomonadota bacterium]MBU1594352.1 hypothetical protein [Pseudomonadota bacterium]